MSSGKKKWLVYLTMAVLAFLSYWGFAWFCSDWRISSGPLRSVDGIIDVLGEPTFCVLAIIGSIGLPIYLLAHFVFLRRWIK